ncbi:hypothetical protein [Ruegeria aquimaris]|uniref:Uncharacterized protein n=1 Tax=Ruegeria aquimaris TaxID=2984333 RepID=A0ABT3AQU4_9RHOB|nr:hypothetical protein [Ruegeria sp. XHP0148]MCV2891041.1 hypothetical protein [Ruegeria sp. XHP0148]
MNRRTFSIASLLALSLGHVPLFRRYFPQRIKSGWLLRDEDV